MIVRLLFSLFLLVAYHTSFSSEIVVADITDMVAGKQQYSYSFAPGDKVRISVTSLKGRTDELQVVEYPGAVRFKTTNVPDVYDQVFELPKGGILTLSLIKLSTGKAKVKLLITREPASDEHANHTTAVRWEPAFDTVWIMGDPKDIRYDTIFASQVLRQVVSTDTHAVVLMDKWETLSPAVNPALAPEARINVYFPKNKTGEEETEELISWAYCVLAGRGTARVWDMEQASVWQAGGDPFKSDPLVALALGMITSVNPEPVDSLPVSYSLVFRNIMDGTEVIDEGAGPMAYGYRTFPLQGAFTIVLSNARETEQEVRVKVVAAVKRTVYKSETVQVVKKVVKNQPKQSAYKLVEKKVPVTDIP